MKTIVGIRPTGKLHIGHYFSVIKPAQKGYDVLIAKYHASPPNHFDCLRLYSQLLDFKIDAKIQKINERLFFKLLSVAKIGELERMTQYKSAKVKTPHLLIYPVLMAHDLYGYHKVIVGEDQRQHVEYANVLFKRLGFPQIKGDFQGGRIMSLTDPSKKMSKSEPEGCLFLNDNLDEMETKLRRAITTKEGIKNLKSIAEQFSMKWDSKDNLKSKFLLARKIRICLDKNLN